MVSTLRPRQSGPHFPKDIFKRIFLYENAYILIKMSLRFFPEVRINNIPALVQIMDWRWLCDKPLSEPLMFNLLTYTRHSALMSYWKFYWCTTKLLRTFLKCHFTWVIMWWSIYWWNYLAWWKLATRHLIKHNQGATHGKCENSMGTLLWVYRGHCK